MMRLIVPAMLLFGAAHAQSVPANIADYPCNEAVADAWPINSHTYIFNNDCTVNPWKCAFSGGHDPAASGLIELTNGNQAVCLAKCEANPTCTAIMTDTSGHGCFLHSSLAQYTLQFELYSLPSTPYSRFAITRLCRATPSPPTPAPPTSAPPTSSPPTPAPPTSAPPTPSPPTPAPPTSAPPTPSPPTPAPATPSPPTPSPPTPAPPTSAPPTSSPPTPAPATSAPPTPSPPTSAPPTPAPPTAEPTSGPCCAALPVCWDGFSEVAESACGLNSKGEATCFTETLCCKTIHCKRSKKQRGARNFVKSKYNAHSKTKSLKKKGTVSANTHTKSK